MSTYEPTKADIAVPLISIILLSSLMICLVFSLMGLTILSAVFLVLGLLGVPVVLGIFVYNVIHFFWKERV